MVAGPGQAQVALGLDRGAAAIPWVFVLGCFDNNHDHEDLRASCVVGTRTPNYLTKSDWQARLSPLHLHEVRRPEKPWIRVPDTFLKEHPIT